MNKRITIKEMVVNYWIHLKLIFLHLQLGWELHKLNEIDETINNKQNIKEG